MTGTWEASYGKVTFSGSCENVTGHWLQGEWGERGTSLRGEISGGRVSGNSLSFSYSQKWNQKKGSDSCYLSDNDKKLKCGYLETLQR